MTHTRVLRAAGLGAVALALVAACGAPPAKEGAANGSSAATAKSAADLGGLDKLVEAAKKEGRLNVIALPPDWANYGEIITAFEAEYGIEVDSAQPDASSQDEINAAKQLKGGDRAPDVFDLGLNVAVANKDLFAPYQVQTWSDIPAELKEPSGLYYGDYGGFMSIGYDAAKVPAPTSVKDLLKPEYQGKVALNGDPTQAGAAFSGVVMASLGNGGSADDIKPGVEFFKQLKAAGNFLPVDPSPATIESGQTPVVLDWDYTNAAQTAKLAGKADWKVVVPQGAQVGAYYNQAVNKDAPHPAAARLWQEFLFSDKGQNLYLKGLSRPARLDALTKSGKVDADANAKLPKTDGKQAFLTQEQSDQAKKVLSETWAQAVG
ncbi:extracellular solute-binding protein [Actinosynnema sp. NPDC047251]|uniref:ABC-type transporter, substrate-binding lipoprotein n=1 Tax=Saccharothrix espanaensis (strain ATCC 51144 / DSM 44229 / JCM 9112 / NBRC 15066 / NRRL 15764) TaxID=1179773 RepID=K0JY73_SACES|nr:extracellular solute-binding protein [Saccharothrix espanaensis]CCH30287.1 ABC-type transporter, substrate-binding lipoprotein [Saccharothrix espanaensis DSM 44229]